ncbi:MAG: large conductance mechanosensitive channel protein MscL [Firmicutes bacterium]|nr:large conductance mechanosensitive channel protein MscL [Bacillota bacterium]
MKSFFREFKEFITKGNMMAMAVGVIVGGAFKAIIDSLVADVFGPIIGIFLGGTDFSKLSIGIGGAQIMIGNFIQAIISFLITALVVFILMRQYNKMQKEAEEEAPEPSDEVKLLTEIRDSLKK